MNTLIPNPLISVIGEIFSEYYTHAEIDSRFMLAGFSTSDFIGNKQQKCHSWLRRANQATGALEKTGKLIEEIMELVPPAVSFEGQHPLPAHRRRLESQLQALGLTYQSGGHLYPAGHTITTRTLQNIVSERDLKGVHDEFERILANIDNDPPAALTASCALLEALLKSYIQEEGLASPSDQSILPLWKVVRSHLNLDAGGTEDDGLRKILSGISSIVDGTASLRTRKGSAHGHVDRTGYRIEARHARLASSAACTLATFLLEIIEMKSRRVPNP